MKYGKTFDSKEEEELKMIVCKILIKLVFCVHTKQNKNVKNNIIHEITGDKNCPGNAFFVYWMFCVFSEIMELKSVNTLC